MEFYDIAMRAPSAATCCSVNPWKSRLALNFKAVPYKTVFISLPDIAEFRRSLQVPACRKFPDGNDYFTLPILVDSSTGAKVGDSFDIALYLQKTYPSSGAGDLFPTQVLDFTYDEELPPWAPPLSVRTDTEKVDYAKFNTYVDAAFTAHVGLMGYYLPLDSDASKQQFIRRAGVSSWEDFNVTGSQRQQMMDSLRVMLGSLAKMFTKDTSGPFILGQRASYADLIVGGWVYMMSRTLPQNKWEAIRRWHDGIFGQLYDALQKYSEVKE